MQSSHCNWKPSENDLNEPRFQYAEYFFAGQTSNPQTEQKENEREKTTANKKGEKSTKI